MATILKGISFRAAEDRDVPAMIEVGRKAFLFAFWELSPIEVIRDWVAQDFEGREYPNLWPITNLATVDDRPVAIIGVRDNYVAGVWIHPNYHRRGIGSRLMFDAEEESRRNGHGKMWLETSEYNAGAPDFYRAIGYTRVSERRVTLSTGISERLTRFEKALSDG